MATGFSTPGRRSGTALWLATCALGVGIVAGCGQATGSGESSACPPVPELEAHQVGNEIAVSWALPNSAGCRPTQLLVVAHSKTISSPAIPARGGPVNVTSDDGTLKIPLRDFDEPPFAVYASTFTREERSRTVVVDVTGGPKVTPAEQRTVRAKREACTPVASAPKTCPRTYDAKDADGLVTELTPSQLADSIRKSLKATSSARATRLVCTRSGTCDARFTIDDGRYRIALRYEVRHLPSAVGKCWVVTSWQVVRPGPFDKEVLPVADRGCVYS